MLIIIIIMYILAISNKDAQFENLSAIRFECTFTFI